MSSILLIIHCLFFTAWPAEHALYIGVVKINCSEKYNEVFVQVFKDDLQDAIRLFEPAFKAAEELLFCEQNQETITQYFNLHLQCHFDNQIAPLQWKEASLLNDSYLLHFQITAPVQWQEISVTADFFMELFPSHSNVIQVKKGDVQWFGRTTITKDVFHEKW